MLFSFWRAAKRTAPSSRIALLTSACGWIRGRLDLKARERRSEVPLNKYSQEDNMSSEVTPNPLIAGINEVRKSWGWFLILGILFMLAGVICIAGDVTATFVTVLFFGWMLLFSGVVALIHAFGTHTWSGFFLYLLSALLRGFTGYVLIRYPGAGAASLP